MKRAIFEIAIFSLSLKYKLQFLKRASGCYQVCLCKLGVKLFYSGVGYGCQCFVLCLWEIHGIPTYGTSILPDA